jgi:hypothetical protein
VQATGPSSSRRSDGADPTLAALAASIQVYLLIPAVALIDALQVNELSELSVSKRGETENWPEQKIPNEHDGLLGRTLERPNKG